MRDAIESMRVAFAELSAGRVDLPQRVSISSSDGAVTLVMPGRLDVPFALGAKIVSVFPGNEAKGLPLIHAAVVLLDGETGEIAGLLDGQSLTAIRTGAASGLATDLLARPDASRVAIIGAGVQARTQLEAVCCVREVEDIWVYSRTRENAERFAREAEETGQASVAARIRVVESAREAVRDADIICTATSSPTPVLGLDDVTSGMHINAVGSFTAEMRELDPVLVGKCRVVVDHRPAAMEEAGEVIAAVREGLISEGDMVEIGEIVNCSCEGRTSDDQITLFKSVGVAVQDLAAGARVVERERKASAAGSELHM